MKIKTLTPLILGAIMFFYGIYKKQLMAMIDTIKSILSTRRFDLANEKNTQLQIEEAFERELIAYGREVKLSSESVIDFLIGGIGIEVKLKGSSKAIYRQCERYCQFDEVQQLILVTNKIMKLPVVINGKPAFVINLGKAWL